MCLQRRIADNLGQNALIAAEEVVFGHVRSNVHSVRVVSENNTSQQDATTPLLNFAEVKNLWDFRETEKKFFFFEK